MALAAQRKPDVKIEITRQAQRYLKGELALAHEKALAFCLDYAQKKHISIRKVEVFPYRTWDEYHLELTLRVLAEIDFKESVAYTQSVCDALDVWLKKQSPALQKLFADRYFIDIEPLKR